MSINKITNAGIENLGQSRVAILRDGSDGRSRERYDSGEGPMLSKENVKNIVDTLNSAAKSLNQRVSFSVHEKTNRIIMRFQDSRTNEVIREILPKEMIRLLERINEMIGMFVDESR